MEKKGYSWKEVWEKTKVSKGTIVRWEKQGYIPKAKRRASNQARIITDSIIEKIIEFRDREVEPPPAKKKRK